MRRIITFLLGLSLLLGVGGALAAEVVPQDITSIDELPFLAQSRPDMTLPAPLTVTVTEKSILFAPQGGKDIYDMHPQSWTKTNRGGASFCRSTAKNYGLKL